MTDGVFNFVQIEGNRWRVSRSKGGTFNAITDSYDHAVLMFLRWMWGGVRRTDKMTFEVWRSKNHFKFFNA